MDIFNWLKMGSFSKLFNSEKTKQSHKAGSGENGVCLNIGICFQAKNWQILWDHFGTHFFMFKFVVKICLTVSLSIFNSSAIILMPKQQSVLHESSAFPHFHHYQMARLFIFFHILSSFWRPLVPFKHMNSWQGGFSISIM